MNSRVGFARFARLLEGETAVPDEDVILEFYGTVIVGATAVYNAGHYENPDFNYARLVSWYPATQGYKG